MSFSHIWCSVFNKFRTQHSLGWMSTLGYGCVSRVAGGNWTLWTLIYCWMLVVEFLNYFKEIIDEATACQMTLSQHHWRFGSWRCSRGFHVSLVYDDMSGQEQFITANGERFMFDAKEVLKKCRNAMLKMMINRERVDLRSEFYQCILGPCDFGAIYSMYPAMMQQNPSEDKDPKTMMWSSIRHSLEIHRWSLNRPVLFPFWGAEYRV